MEVLINNLEQELFSKLKMCKDKIIVVSPFLSLKIAEKLVNIVKGNNIKCKVITRFDRKSFIDKASSLDALKLLIENNVKILALKDLHSKVYIIDNKSCFVGSANFTNKGLNINHELLLYLDKNHEVDKVNFYANELITNIEQSGNWLVTIEQIRVEQEIIENYKESQKDMEKVNYTWGSELTSDKIDQNSIVLSVPVGSTIHLIEKYFVHAHPISSGYNYTPTKYITFRRPNGGVMARIYDINKTFPIPMKEWRQEIENIEMSDSVKENLINYIVKRYRDFEFDKAPEYKFYILSLLCDLPN
jgi:phosphatidylserine/phosphatidylglycerophosphate/cardiolipin synthase-like enzyme